MQQRLDRAGEVIIVDETRCNHALTHLLPRDAEYLGHWRATSEQGKLSLSAHIDQPFARQQIGHLMRPGGVYPASPHDRFESRPGSSVGSCRCMSDRRQLAFLEQEPAAALKRAHELAYDGFALAKMH